MPARSETISVVIPAFNAAETITETIHSVLAQRLAGEIEVDIIVVDDASTDDTPAVVVALSERYPGTIRLIRQAANAGPAAARNVGMRAAIGSLICFLDADDEYALGFFDKAVAMLAAHPRVAAVLTSVALVNMHREIHRLQLDDVVKSLPSNVLMKCAVVELIGGFPEHAIFRGASAGEDLAFKQALLDNFLVLHIEDEFLLHRVRRGGHLDRFLDTTEVVDGRRVFINLPAEQADGSLLAAIDAFSRAAADRMRCADQTRIPSAFNADGGLDAEAYEPLRIRFDAVPGTMSPVAGFALHRAAAFGPGAGWIVVRAQSPERAIAWLGAGTQSASRRPIIAHPVADEPIRLLFIDLELPSWRAEFQQLARHITPSGCVAFDGMRDDADVEAAHAEMLRAHLAWNEIGRVGTLRVYKKA